MGDEAHHAGEEKHVSAGTGDATHPTAQDGGSETPAAAPVVYSAALPPHLLEQRRKKREAEAKQAEQAPPEPKKRVMGPSLDALLGGSEDEEQEEEVDDTPFVGPVFYSTPEEAQAARLKALEKKRKAIAELKDETDVKESGAAKKARRKKAMKKDKKRGKSSSKSSGSRRGVDEETDKALEKYNSIMRKESLLQQHVRKRKKELDSESSQVSYRPWDRERDLTHRPMNAERRNKMIMDSQALGNRFSHGKSKYKH